MALFSVAAVVVGALALAHLDQQRQRIESTIDPAALAVAAALQRAAEPGDRGARLRAQRPAGLPHPLHPGPAAEKTAATQLTPARAAVARRQRRRPQGRRSPRPTTGAPATRSRRSSRSRPAGKPVVSPDILAGKAEFDALRVKLDAFQADVVERPAARRWPRWTDASTELDVALLAIAIGLSVVVAGWPSSCAPPRSARCTGSPPRRGGSPTAISATRWPRSGRGRSAAWPPT